MESYFLYENQLTCSNSTCDIPNWDIQRMIGDLQSLKVIGNLTPCGTFWVRKEDNKDQEVMLQNISDGIAWVFQLQYFIPLVLYLHVNTPSL